MIRWPRRFRAHRTRWSLRTAAGTGSGGNRRGWRLGGRDGIARALYVAAADREVVVVRAFAKKTWRTRRREIELALRRAREVLP